MSENGGTDLTLSTRSFLRNKGKWKTFVYGRRAIKVLKLNGMRLELESFKDVMQNSILIYYAFL